MDALGKTKYIYQAPLITIARTMMDALGALVDKSQLSL